MYRRRLGMTAAETLGALAEEAKEVWTTMIQVWRSREFKPVRNSRA